MDILINKINECLKTLAWIAQIESKIFLETYEDETCCFVLKVITKPIDREQDSIGFITEIPVNSIDDEDYIDNLITDIKRALNESYLGILH